MSKNLLKMTGVREPVSAVKYCLSLSLKGLLILVWATPAKRQPTHRTPWKKKHNRNPSPLATNPGHLDSLCTVLLLSLQLLEHFGLYILQQTMAFALLLLFVGARLVSLYFSPSSKSIRKCLELHQLCAAMSYHWKDHNTKCFKKNIQEEEKRCGRNQPSSGF